MGGLTKETELPKVPTETPVEPPKPVDKMPWLTAAKLDEGQKEIVGDKDNPFIVECFRYTSYWSRITAMLRKRDEVPWCAAYVCRRLREAGYRDTNSAAAKSYLTYGEACGLQVGAVVVLKNPKTGQRHVTFCDDSMTSSSNFAGRGGNQGNMCKVSLYSKAHIEAVRWPVKK